MSPRWRWTLGLLLLGVVGRCSTSASPPCGPATCGGCCNQGQCTLAESDALCGTGGGACDDCGSRNLVCMGAQCVSPGSCLPQGQACPNGGCCSGLTCQGGTCTSGSNDAGNGCATGFTPCPSGCANLQDDPNNCNTCGHACGANGVCSNGSCQTIANCNQTPCPSGYFCNLNSGQCSPGCASNGDCPQPGTCDIATHQCQCSAGYHSCGGGCVAENASSCGAGCSACPSAPADATEACATGVCSFSCNSGFHVCGGACASDTDPNNCGASCTQCTGTANGEAVCQSGACGTQCDPSFHACATGGCASDTDPNNCGPSCAQCGGTANGSALCQTDGGCGFQCDTDYVPCSTGCCADCRVSGCTGFTWCDTTSGLCQSGCALNSDCQTDQVCCEGQHICQLAVDTTCPAGYQDLGTCSDFSSDFCVSGCLPSGTTYPWQYGCDAGTTDRGSWTCGPYTNNVCVPDGT